MSNEISDKSNVPIYMAAGIVGFLSLFSYFLMGYGVQMWQNATCDNDNLKTQANCLQAKPFMVEFGKGAQVLFLIMIPISLAFALVTPRAMDWNEKRKRQ